MWDFSKKAVALLVVIIITFVVTTLGFVVQTFNIASSNTATIIAGVMGMLGGFIGAMGAYLASINQMEKQFEKQDRDRLVEINLKNFNALLMISYDYLYDIPLIRSKSDSYVAKEDEEEELKRILDEKDSYIKQFKKYESMTKSKIDFKELYEKIECMKKDTTDGISKYHDTRRKIVCNKRKLDLSKLEQDVTDCKSRISNVRKDMTKLENQSNDEGTNEERRYVIESVKSHLSVEEEGLKKYESKYNEAEENIPKIEQQIRELEVNKEELKNNQQRSLDALEETLENNIQIIEDYIEELLSIE